MKQILKNAGVLLAVTLVAAVGLSVVYQLAKEPIARAELQAKAEAYTAVYADAVFANVEDADAVLQAYNATLPSGTAVKEILAANNAGGAHMGYVLSVTATGYAGAVEIALGIEKSGVVVGYAVLSHNETPGFGANCENADVRQQFIGITSADEIDGITGATYTTNALKSETQAAIDLVKQLEGGGK